MPVLTKINTNSIAEDAITGDKFAGDAYLSNTANQNISGTYSENRLYTSDAYTLSGNATVNSHITLSTIKSSGDVVLTAGGAYTITGTGVLSAGSLLAKVNTDLTGMTGELGSVVTGTPAISGNFPSITGLGTVTSGTLGSEVIHRLGSSNIKSADGSTTAMISDTAGVVKFPQVPAFSTYGTNYTSVDGTAYKVVAAGELFDNGNNYSAGRFTAPVAGMYFFSFWTLLYNITEGNVSSAQYRVNGSTAAGNVSIGSSQGIQGGMTAGNHTSWSGTFLTELNENDYIELFASVNPGQFYAGQCNMCGLLVG